MTLEAEMAKDVSIQLECKKHKLSQNVDGGWQLVLNIHPDDMPTEILADPMGQRYVSVFVPINDDETPKVKPKSYAQRAVMMCKDEVFNRYVLESRNFGQQEEDNEANCRKFLLQQCWADSRAKLIEGTDAGRRFINLQAEFLQWKNN